MPTPPSAYRPDIDGLRALAVVGVLLFHLDERWLPGGFVGVDVFFVISGFLITSIIDRDLQAGTFSIAKFYERRIRRIFPALFAVICAVLAACWFVMLPLDLLALGKSIRYALLGFSNVHFLRVAEDYFNDSVSEIPLLHTWSLGVEEQFYLVFPFLMILLYRLVRNPGRRVIPLAAMLLISLAASIWIVQTHPMKGFYLLPFRAWELLVGSLLALVRIPQTGLRVTQAAGLTGLGMIAASMALFDARTPFPGAAALLPCVGAALFIFAGRNPASWANRLLALKPVVFIGLISYSLYLWHWPLIALAKYLTPYHEGIAGGVFGASLLAGFLSWRFIERPFRNPSFGSRRKVFICWAVPGALLLAGCLSISRTRGFPQRYSREVNHLLAAKQAAPHWKAMKAHELEPEKSVVFGAPGVPPRFALWGDSHGRALVPALEAMAKISGQAFRGLGATGLPPVVGVVLAADEDARERFEFTETALRLLEGEPSISTVILHARWSSYCRGSNGVADLQGGRRFYGQSFASDGESDQFYAANIRQTVDRLLAAGKKVVLVYPSPEAGVNVPDFLARQAIVGAAIPETLDCSGFSERHSFVMAVLNSLGDSERIVRIKPHEKLLQKGRLTVWAGGESLFMDDNHLSVAGALHIKELFKDVFSDPASPVTAR